MNAFFTFISYFSLSVSLIRISCQRVCFCWRKVVLQHQDGETLSVWSDSCLRW